MIREARQKAILEHLDKNDCVAVRDIVRSMKASHMTVNRDLISLEKQGLLIRKHGAIVKSGLMAGMFSFTRKLEIARQQKTDICARAADFISDGDTIFIDHGSTMYMICEYIRAKKGLHIITNSLPIASQLMNYPSISINLAGGEVISERKACYGTLTQRALEKLHADKAFVGADGVCLENGISTFDELDGEIIRTMASNAKAVFLLSDSSKFEKKAYYRIMPLKKAGHVITDGGISRSLARKYRAAGINLCIAKSVASGKSGNAL